MEFPFIFDNLDKKGKIKMKSMNLFGDNKTKDMTSVEDMFVGCKSLNQLDPSRSKAEDMTGIEDIFSDCKSLT